MSIYQQILVFEPLLSDVSLRLMESTKLTNKTRKQNNPIAVACPDLRFKR